MRLSSSNNIIDKQYRIKQSEMKVSSLNNLIDKQYQILTSEIKLSNDSDLFQEKCHNVKIKSDDIVTLYDIEYKCHPVHKQFAASKCGKIIDIDQRVPMLGDRLLVPHN